MCGCMLVHAVMHRQDHPSTPHTATEPEASAAQLPSGQRCVHCGFPLLLEYAYCPGCGMGLREAKGPEVCPACGQRVKPGWSACAFCGSPLGEALRRQP